MPGSQSKKILNRMSNELNAELIPGLIHEVNNALTGIYFNLENCNEILSPEHPALASLHDITCGVERIKTVLARSMQIHLNTMEREKGYHELESLLHNQIDLLRIIFPRTTKVKLVRPNTPLHVFIAEHPFRVVLLAVASLIRQALPPGKNTLNVEILPPEQTAEAIKKHGGAVLASSVGISFVVPLAPPEGNPNAVTIFEPAGDLTLENAKNLAGEIGAEVLFSTSLPEYRAEALLVFPHIDINS